ncbi:MAG: GDSL-type esterase/lipase family protein [Kiritimatiellales bacterium]
MNTRREPHETATIRRAVCPALLLVSMITASSFGEKAASRTLLRESFESAPTVPWQHVRGEAANSPEQAHAGGQSLKCTVENKYGMSVHYYDLPARAGATYTLSAFLFIPRQDKECFPQLQLCNVNWGVKTQATPAKNGEWEKLRCQWTNTENLKTVRVALHDNCRKEGLGGAAYFWDDVELTEEGGASIKPGERGRNPDALSGLEVKSAGGMKITLTAGRARVLGREVSVAETTLDIAPPQMLTITDEATTLTDEVPLSFGKGTALLQCLGSGPTLPCLEPGSIVVKEKPGSGGLMYEQGKDWRTDGIWGRVGRLPEGRIQTGQKVYIDYRTHLLRVDTLCIDPDGRVSLRQGDSQKVCPSIPAADHGSLALCRIFIDYGCRAITEKEIYPAGEDYLPPDVDFLSIQRARVAKTREKLEQGQDVTLVAWGDSVTAGGEASRPELRFADAFVQALRYKYPNARIKFINAGRGGWTTSQSLPLFADDVLKYKPDLVTMEFVNDMGLDAQTMRKNWSEAIDRVRAAGGESIVVTPHFEMPARMNFPGSGTPETRPNVAELRKISEEKQVALADASKRWEHLGTEGIPYPVHLHNGINHPDDFGHAIFVEELMRLF